MTGNAELNWPFFDATVNGWPSVQESRNCHPLNREQVTFEAFPNICRFLSMVNGQWSMVKKVQLTINNGQR